MCNSTMHLVPGILEDLGNLGILDRLDTLEDQLHLTETPDYLDILVNLGILDCLETLEDLDIPESLAIHHVLGTL